MDNYQQNLQEEMKYLANTVSVLKQELARENQRLSTVKSNLISLGKDMWENTAHSTADFDKVTEMNQYLSAVMEQTVHYQNILRQVEKYKKMISCPYFGRFDFIEDGCAGAEKIYVGLATVMDTKTDNVIVYDWRAPIASIYYRYELGKVAYDAPAGTITGEVKLKRQYKIQDSQLKYFFDCSIVIKDEILQEILGRNASPKMKTIVETIQKEQDFIIRDMENELLIVQGVAGSGKTSIALHRVAFLLYQGLGANLKAHNVMIISPNRIFSSYIANVLPELGEANVEQRTFGEIIATALAGRFKVESREEQLESIIILGHTKEGDVRRQSINFKGSRTFKQILDRLLWHYARKLIPFTDVYFAGQIIATRQQLKNHFLNDKTGLPMAKRLKRLESMILDKVHPLRRKRLERIEKIVQQSERHDLEIKSFSRLLSIKEARAFRERLEKFTSIDFWQLYYILFNQPGLLLKLAKGLELPGDIDRIVATTRQALQAGEIFYEDCAPLLYLKLKLEGSDIFPDIKQVVIDEAQDYYPLQYEVFKLLFPEANYTVLGDINQTMEKNSDDGLYDEVAAILDKKKTTKLFLNKSYRSSYEINMFNRQLLGEQGDFIPFERHTETPQVVQKETEELMDQAIVNDANYFLDQGYATVAIICKTLQDAQRVHAKIKDQINVKLMQPSADRMEKGIMVIPSYIAKGLEFDVVLLYDASQENYSSEFDKKLLYIGCTRALHRLRLYYCGERSPLI